ncbi:hypothetical protein Csa_011073, partial [Cucumis sativus]
PHASLSSLPFAAAQPPAVSPLLSPLFASQRRVTVRPAPPRNLCLRRSQVQPYAVSPSRITLFREAPPLHLLST